MSTPNTEVLGIQVTAGSAAPVQVPGVDILAITGTGPGTLPLAIVGLLTLAAGLVASIFGRSRRRAENPGGTGPLRDLSHLAHGPIRELA